MSNEMIICVILFSPLIIFIITGSIIEEIKYRKYLKNKYKHAKEDLIKSIEPHLTDVKKRLEEHSKKIDDLKGWFDEN